MPTIYKCGICGQECKGLNGLMLHKLHAHPEEIEKKAEIPENPEEYLDDDDLEIEHDPFAKAYWKREHTPEEKQYDTYELYSKIHRLENIIRKLRNQPEEDSTFDKLLNQFTKIAMIKQLTGNSGNEILSQMMAFQKFLDSRELPQEDDIATSLIKTLVPEIVKKKSDVNQTHTPNKEGVKTPPFPQLEGDNTLPTEKELLEMSDYKIAELLRPNIEMVKSLKLTKEQAYQNMLAMYPNFPEKRFDTVWRLLFGDDKK